MKYWILISLLFLSVETFATKPCNPSPCFTDSTAQKFDKEKCTSSSDWVAVGEIQIKAHDFIGMPLNRDFVLFDFIVKDWEKSITLKKAKIPFKVGWCMNQMFPYENSKGLFRFYGILHVDREGEKEYRYLYIEKL